MQGDLAVGTRAQLVATIGERALMALVVVELAVHDHVEALVLVRDRLVARREIDDAEPRMAEPDPAVRRDPLPPPVRTAVMECGSGGGESFGRDGLLVREHRDDAAHGGAP